MNDPTRVRMSGPLKPYMHGFGAELSRLGYTPISAAAQLRLMAHLSRWLAGEDLDASRLTAGAAKKFLAIRHRAGYRDYRSMKALRPLMTYLRGLGATPPEPPVRLTPVEALLERYGAYVRRERGVSASTVRGYVDMVRPFLALRERPDGELSLQDLRPGDVTGFVVSECPRRNRGSAKLLVTSLRSLLSYLYVVGLLTQPVTEAVPSVAHWRFARLPKPLEADGVRRMLATCNRSRATGIRDFAVITILARLGLRRGEVAGLQLENVDWRQGEITIHGKGGQYERLPLPTDVGQALVAYLRGARPKPVDGCRNLFLLARAPHRALTPSAVAGIVRIAASRAGLPQVTPHRLRHTVATRLLETGASLEEIGQLLRHRRQLTTAMYAKVDRGGLSTLARPWPGGAA